MKRMLLLMVALVALPVIAGTMYEWRDPATGKLMLGDKPPSGGVQYWIEGQPRPEEKAVKEKREAEKSAKDKREAELESARKVEQDKRNAEWIEEGRRHDKELQKLHEEKCKDGDRYGIKIGMTKEDFKICFPIDPDQINTTETSSGIREQWVYSSIKQYYYSAPFQVIEFLNSLLIYNILKILIKNFQVFIDGKILNPQIV